MANWCSNVVWFEADEATMAKLRELFLQMAEKGEQTDCGQLPPFIDDDTEWFFDIRWEAEDTLCYETRWSPNIDAVRKIADYYGVGFVHEYAEPGNYVFGRAAYGNGKLTNIRLHQEAFYGYGFDEET